MILSNLQCSKHFEKEICSSDTVRNLECTNYLPWFTRHSVWIKTCLLYYHAWMILITKRLTQIASLFHKVNAHTLNVSSITYILIYLVGLNTPICYPSQRMKMSDYCVRMVNKVHLKVNVTSGLIMWLFFVCSTIITT